MKELNNIVVLVAPEKTDNGFCFKNIENFDKQEGVCYINEFGIDDVEPCCEIDDVLYYNLNDFDKNDIYTYNDFLRIAKNDKDIANLLFEVVDWQKPETLYEEFDFEDLLYFEEKENQENEN